MMDPDYMRAFAHHESTGEWPDEVYIPTEEDLQDPDHMEVAELVIEQYKVNNEAKRARREREEILRLRELLEAHGIGPDRE